MSEGRARYAREHGTWILKLGGDVRHPLGPAINALLDCAIADPEFRHFIVDLEEAELIDSTCLGVLARIANHHAQLGISLPTIVAPNPDISATLQAICFDQAFQIVPAGYTGTDALERLPDVSPADDELRTLVLEAHRRLCDLDARTREVFKNLVEALEAEQLRCSRSR